VSTYVPNPVTLASAYHLKLELQEKLETSTSSHFSFKRCSRRFQHRFQHEVQTVSNLHRPTLVLEYSFHAKSLSSLV